MSRAVARRAFDALEAGLVPLALRRPEVALSGAAALGGLRGRLSGRWPSAGQVRSLFPHLDRGEAARTARAIAALEARNRLLVACIRRAGLDPVRPLVDGSALAGLRPPLILGTFHAGAVHALGPALERLPGPVLALRDGPLFRPRPPLELATTEGDDQSRAAVFHRALTCLRRGGFVALALDVAPGPVLRVPCLGRALELPRGPFALARLAGAPIVPVAARWRGSKVEVAAGEPLVPLGKQASVEGERPEQDGERETALAAAAASWLERYLNAAPAETGLGLLRRLLY